MSSNTFELQTAFDFMQGMKKRIEELMHENGVASAYEIPEQVGVLFLDEYNSTWDEIA